MSKKTNLGPVTAYALAVADGFVGTLKEWLESLKGDKGDKGDPGEKGDPGQKGDPGPAGIGVPDGGTEGQIIVKTADGAAWADLPESGLPSGGTPYQQLVTDGDGNAKWENKPYFIVNLVDSSYNSAQGITILTLDATSEQIYTAYQSGKRVVINMSGFVNAQVQKYPDGKLYAIGFMPQETGTNGLTKLAMYYLESRESYWILQTTYISATTE